MRVPLSWLDEYLSPEERAFAALASDPQPLLDRLAMLGFGHESPERVGDDLVLDLEIASNRPDLLSILGVAREIGAAWELDTRVPPVVANTTSPATSSVTQVSIDEPDLCPRFTAHVIDDVHVDPSPDWMQRRLELGGIRSINNIVDVTNYVMLEVGQPMHAFDLDRLEGRRLVVRRARPGERLVTLDGVERTLDAHTLVVADADRATAVAGIIGGADTEIREGTTRVLLEAASWAPAQIRRTSRRLGVRTESSTRFERGLDRRIALDAARRAAALITEVAGGRILDEPLDVYPRKVPSPVIVLRPARVHRILGMAVDPDRSVDILRRLGCAIEAAGETLRVIPPPGRLDLEREADLIEEIARHVGYDRIPEAMPVEVTHAGGRAAGLTAEAAARDVLVRAGLTEAITISLITPRLLDRLGLEADDPWRRPVPLLNPFTAEHTHLRPAVLPGLLEAVRVNVSRRRESVHLFEIGRVFRAGPGVAGIRDGAAVEGTPTSVEERRSLAIALHGRWLVGDWDGPAHREATYYHLKGIVETLATELRIGTLAVQAGGPPWLHPARAGRVMLDGQIAGSLGELHPDVGARFDLPDRTFVAEIDLEAVLARAVLQPRFTGLPRYPAVRRDVAVVAPQTLPHAAVEAALRESAGSMLESVELFDVYEGPPLDAGERNLAYALTLRAPDRTLTGEEVEAMMRLIHERLPARLPVRIRT
ncbi:MAG: phenylalanine--tRNA ligase subunit beta [bacterium]